MDVTAICVKKIVVYLGSYSFVCYSSSCAFFQTHVFQTHETAVWTSSLKYTGEEKCTLNSNYIHHNVVFN